MIGAGGVADVARRLALAAGLVLLAVVGLLRPLLPIDETRYAAVAWEMWQRGDLLLPVLGGQPYAQKPPLLFWLMHAGWAMFGVNALWPRLIAPCFAAGTLLLCAALARQLWPLRPGVATRAPWLLLASPLFAYFASALMFDMALSFFVALGWLGLVRAADSGGRWRHFGLLACGLAGALYSKGPVALVHLLPAALLAPWWVGAGARLGAPWYRRVTAALLLATLAILAWAVPAALAGGADYRDAIFWRQSAGRMSDSFAHAAPWYTYLVALPLVLAPWFVWPRWWRGLWQHHRQDPRLHDRGLRLLLVVLAASLLFFSLASGKRLHYLLPELMLLALLMARGLDEAQPVSRWTLAAPALVLAAAGVVLIGVARPLTQRFGLDDEHHILYAAGVVPLLAAAALIRRRPDGSVDDLRHAAGATLVSLAVPMLALNLALSRPYDVDDVAARLARHEAAGHALAVRGPSHGEWTFAGRLRQAPQAVAAADAVRWLAEHPQGRMVWIYHDAEPPPPGVLEHVQRYRGGWLAIVTPG